MTWNCQISRFCSTVHSYQAKDSFLKTLMVPSHPKKSKGSLLCWEEFPLKLSELCHPNIVKVGDSYTLTGEYTNLSNELFKCTWRVELIKSFLKVSLFDGLFGRDNGLGLGVKFKIIWFEKRSHHCYYYLSRRSMCVCAVFSDIDIFTREGDRSESKRKHFRGIFRSRAGSHSHLLKDILSPHSTKNRTHKQSSQTQFPL